MKNFNKISDEDMSKVKAGADLYDFGIITVGVYTDLNTGKNEWDWWPGSWF